MKTTTEQPITKIISASAGTGKTYRLSLEYITLLLRYERHPDFSLDNILVITFTRKATAEIRERIQAHLHLLLYPTKDNAKDRSILLQNLRRFTATANSGEDELSANEYRLLSRVYHEVCTQKHLLRVMTIDSFIGNIFRNLICPVRGIDRFEIDEDATGKRMPFLMPYVMSDDILNGIRDIFRSKIYPSLDEYKPFFVSLVKLRWLYFLMTRRPVGADDSILCRHLGASEYWDREAQAQLGKCRHKLYQLFMTVEQDINSRVEKPESKGIREYYKSDLIKLLISEPYTTDQLIAMSNDLLTDPQKCQKLLKVIASNKHALYNGSKFRNKEPLKHELDAITKEAVRYLADHLIFKLLLPEQQNILDLWGDILSEYDRLMYRYKDLSYDDVTWLTFEALYSDDPPLFDPQDENTANEFYHFLSHRTRVILIDEFQDTSILQFNILKPILDEVVAGQGSKPFGGFIVVGDEKQSIFGWREGERELLVNLSACFPQCANVLTEPLTDCWRSSTIMLEAINSIFMEDTIHRYLDFHGLKWKYETIRGRADKHEQNTYIRFNLVNYQTRSSKNPILRLDRMRQFVRHTIVPNLRKIDTGETIAVIARKNSELTDLQSMLEEEGFGSIFQPSALLIDHRLVYPLLSFIRFTVYRDWLDLFKVLRSDYVLMPGAEFKRLCLIIAEYDKRNPITAEPVDLSAIPFAQRYFDLMLKADELTLYDLCLAMIDSSHLDLKHVPDRDLINVNAFLDLLREYESSAQGTACSAPDFLQYCQDKSKQEVMKQRSIERKDAVQLLTIHKSKGLEFDHVFFWYDLTPQTPHDNRLIDCFYQYAGHTFENLHDFALTYQYADVLQHSSWAYLAEEKNRRDELEELNTIYVAVTRAKQCLYVMLGFQSTKEWDEFLAESKGKSQLPLLLADSFRKFITDKGYPDDLGWSYGAPSRLVPKDHGSQDETSALADITPEQMTTLSPILPPLIRSPFSHALPNPDRRKLDWKKIWIVDRSALIGQFAHDYLARLIRNTPEERNRGLENSLIKYGNILRADDIRVLCQKIDAALIGYPDLFDPAYDKIFTEREIWHQGKEYRIDRLMINSRDKSAWIVDYKTGEINEFDQLDIYAAALMALPIFRQAGYACHKTYIELNGIHL